MLKPVILKTMNKNIITIDDNGAVTVPHKVKMRDFEIANLLGLTYPAVRGKIKVLLKSGRYEDFGGGEFVGNTLISDYWGFDMVIAIAFAVNTYQADIFKRYVMRKILKGDNLPIFISIPNVQSRDINLC